MWLYKSDLFIFGGYIATKGFLPEMWKLNMKDMNSLKFEEVKFIGHKHMNQNDDEMSENQKKELK